MPCPSKTRSRCCVDHRQPLIFSTLGPLERWLRQHRRLVALLERPAGSLSELPQTVDEHTLRDHAVLVGHGGVGEPIAQAFEGQGIPYVVVEQNCEVVEALQERGLPVVYGDAWRPVILAALAVEHGLRLATTDGGFARFARLQWFNPLRQTGAPAY